MKAIEKLTDADIVKELAEWMGWEVSDDGFSWCDGTAGECLCAVDDFNPLLDANDMLMVVEAMVEKGWSMKMDCWRTKEGLRANCRWRLLCCEEGHVNFYPDTPCRAVCLAALKAIRAMKETK